ncbi:MAG: hypothetical protein QCH96_02355 [Candidatus Thermoplasmatota archaeon]|nr:hypothetical protein [Candidatus Thermoplasmatota archaeon]
MNDYQKQILEKWLRQLKNNEIDPEALDLGSDRSKAIASLTDELNRIANKYTFKK